MNRYCLPFCITMAFALINMGLRAQGSEADYGRAEAYVEKIRDKVYHSPSSFTWVEGQPRFWYSQLTQSGFEFIVVDVEGGDKGPAFDHERLALSLSETSGEKVTADDLPFRAIKLTNDNHVEVNAFEKRWRISLRDYQTEELSRSESQDRWGRGGYWGASRDDRKGDPVVSPDSLWDAYIKNSNLYVKQRSGDGEETQLSYDGSPGAYYAADIQWSPDSRKLAVNKVRPNTPRILQFIESSPSDQLQPKLHERPYLKPGDALPQYQPVLFLLESGESFAIDPNLVANQYSLSRPQWRADSREFTFEYNQRGHQRYEVFAVDGSTGTVRSIIAETSPTFIDYSGKKYRKDIDDGKEIIWASERDGWNHLYRYDGTTGSVKNQITKGDWVVREVIHVDEADRYIIFTASGREKGQDPYLIQYYRVGFNGEDLVALTVENGNHRATFSPDYRVFVDTYSRVDEPQTTVLRSTSDGRILLHLEKADITALENTGWQHPEVFHSKGRDGATDIWGIIVRPTNFDPNKKYPVIEYIYAGPHSSFVPKSFSTNPSGLGALAELGFIVVQIDGMGTSNRSKAFHDVCWRNLKDAGFPDRIAWMEAAAEQYSYMDLNRVGIYGTSAGGQSAAGALLFHPEFYKVAVSSCGCHDNRMDKIWWNEQWMGYPIGPHYAESSNVVNAHKLEGKLMLIVGELDDNVDPASTLQVVDALIKAKKDHEFIMVPGMGHSSGGDYGERKRRDFFVKHLLGVSPPAWN